MAINHTLKGPRVHLGKMKCRRCGKVDYSYRVDAQRLSRSNNLRWYCVFSGCEICCETLLARMRAAPGNQPSPPAPGPV